MTHGLVLGKFLPPHAGHVYLIETARRLCDELTIVVGTLDREPIAGALRARWVRELFPDLRVVHLTDDNPQDPSEHPEFWAIWKRSLEAVLPGAVDVVFASEAYGGPLAATLGARWVPVDRKALAVSGTAVRQRPAAYWSYLPAPVRAHLIRRVSVFGPESTGKSTLAAALAAHYRTVAVPEYARTYLEARRPDHIAAVDLEAIAHGQAASEDALASRAERVLICDTDPSLTQVWSDCLGHALEIAPRRYHLTLLTDVDLPWVADPVRYLPDDRADFLARCEARLSAEGRRFVTIRGDRLTAAIAAIDALLAEPLRWPEDVTP